MNKKYFFIFFFLMLLSKSLFANSLFLVNDSPFTLIAIVQTATGEFLGQVPLQAGEQKHWSLDLKKTHLKEFYNQEESITPFTVIWKCSYKGYYSVGSNISPGAAVSAQSCPGAKFCVPRPKKTENSLNKEKEENE